MPMTVRLSARTERAVDTLARRRRQTRSDVVRDALESYTATNGSGADRGRPYDAWLDVIGVVRAGARVPERRTPGEEFAAIVREKARARRAR
jgi:Arc/MetJ-type ribon-helix-helix transcriptional regulator